MVRTKMIFDMKQFLVKDQHTVCHMRCTLHLPPQIEKNFLAFYGYEMIPKRWKNRVWFDVTGICFNVVGVTKHYESDKFDELRGKHIAESKAKTKGYRLAKNIVQMCNQYIESQLVELQKANTDFKRLVDAEKLHVKELCN